VLTDGLLDLDADLLTLLETIVDNGHDQAADLLDSRYEIIHQQDLETDGQGISTTSRWPVGEIIELDINVTSRTGDLACASLITEILAPPPLHRIWLVNNLPDWQPDHEHERELQAVRPQARPRHRRRRLRRRPRRRQHPVLDRAAVTERAQRLLPRRRGVRPARRTRPHVRPRQPQQRRLGLALPPDRLHPDPLRPARRPHLRGQQLQADLRPPRQRHQRPLRASRRPDPAAAITQEQQTAGQLAKGSGSPAGAR
jgi:hypothetical protein